MGSMMGQRTPGERGRGVGRWNRWRAALRVVLGLFFVAGGILHFLKPEAYVQIVPPYLPYPLALVYVSGVFEILGGCGVLIPRLRKVAGWGLIALLVAVFPANLHMALGDVQVQGLSVSPLLLWLRLPLQLVLIVWVYWCTTEDLSRTPGAEGSDGLS
jgi:uncharacterized membrane protein